MFATAVERVFRPARSKRIVRRWQGLPSWLRFWALDTTPTPHSGLPACTTRSPKPNTSCVIKITLLESPAGVGLGRAESTISEASVRALTFQANAGFAH